MSRLPAAERKSQLLDTAAKVFATHGYAGTTTAQLAKAAGVSEPIIYRHFKSKKDLFIELVERTSEETIGFWQKELTGLTDAAERLMRLIRSNPMVSPRGAVRYRVIVQAMTEASEPEIRAALQGHMTRLHRFIQDEIQAAQDGGQVSRRFTPELTAWALIHMALGYGTLAALGVPGQGSDKQGNHVDDIIGLFMLAERYRKEAPPSPSSPPSAPQ